MHVPPDVCVLVADYGIGDHYIVAGLADAVRERFGVRVWLAGKPRMAFIAELFPAIEHYLNWPPNLLTSTIKTPRIHGGTLFHAHFPELELMRAVGYNGFHFLDAYRCRLGLPYTAVLSTPRAPEDRGRSAAERVLRARGIDSAEVVLLSCETGTTPTGGVAGEFWLRLAVALRKAGLRPLVNAGPTTKVPEGMEAVEIPLEDVRSVACACRGVCSIRSGLSDLLCDLPIRHAVVYPNVVYWAGPLLEGTTFARYGLSNPPQELVVSPNCGEGVIQSLATWYLGSSTGSLESALDR